MATAAPMVFLAEIAPRLGMDRSNARRYVIELGYAWRKVRAANGQLSNALPLEDADAIVERRQLDGFTAKGLREAPEAWGQFYVIRLIPDLAPQRIKLGFASSVSTRLAAHRTAAPTAELVKSWPCRRTWEISARDAAVIRGCAQIGPEVFDCADVAALVGRCDAFFALMPSA
jgi:hypothetical protein